MYEAINVHLPRVFSKSTCEWNLFMNAMLLEISVRY